MQDEVYEDEIEFDDPPIVDEIPSDELDNIAVASSPTSIKTCRGKALHWEEHASFLNGVTITYPTLEKVSEDVENNNHSKMCSYTFTGQRHTSSGKMSSRILRKSQIQNSSCLVRNGLIIKCSCDSDILKSVVVFDRLQLIDYH